MMLVMYSERVSLKPELMWAPGRLVGPRKRLTNSASPRKGVPGLSVAGKPRKRRGPAAPGGVAGGYSWSRSVRT